MHRGRIVSIGIMAVALLAAPPGALAASPATTALQAHFDRDHDYRVRYYAGWGFFWLLAAILLIVMAVPKQHRPQPQRG